MQETNPKYPALISTKLPAEAVAARIVVEDAACASVTLR